MNRTRWFDIGAVVFAVAIVVGIAGVSCSARETGPLAAPPNVSGGGPAPADARPLALFIGDSYTAGKSSAEMSYGCRAAVEMGWLCALAAVGDTGYIAGGPAYRWTDPYLGSSLSYSERVAHLSAKYDPAVVVLDGGRNDDFASQKYRFDAMLSTIVEVRRTWPHATVVFIRPRLLANPGDNVGLDDNFMALLQSEPGAQGVVFIDPIYSFVDTDTSRLLGPDGVHPNREGERLMTRTLVDALVSQRVGSSS
ncbi:lysophospholipase L1-like esterase [Mycobacterium frederiksbergense]|uniref:Lysophospholipase L1-like esterase n=1 Tax=Mycolicibacterium frederiksbergense TaxID=117567 RepID=A0ABT6KZU6_9MYCO|nr:SGNH/GDSL hydrolase family protein [Mycolicibacterium frederiksbergense]MDH6196215.1 lysophospholipase L1-like esterase [Mycolicibacterium frederiksbergense]